MTHRSTSGGVVLLRRAWLPLLLLVATSWTQAQLTSGTSTSATSPTSTSASAPQATCGPSGTGQTACGGDGVASQNLNEVDAGAGNPIHLITGNKYQREEDLPALPGVLGLEIVRHYNSQFSRLSTPNGIMGRGWKLSYETRLYPGEVSLQVVQADGARIIFSKDPLHPSVCTTSDPSQGQIKVIKSPQGRRYEWIWPSGKVLSFNAQGRLTQILAPTGEFVSLQYSGTGLLVSVTDPQNRSLRLNYLDSREAAKREKFTGVVSIDTPVGRFAYEYGSAKPQGSQITDRELRANLVKVNLPTRYNPDEQAHPLTQRGTTSSTLSRLYHYEDARWPTLLTGISVQATGQAGQLSRQRLATWGYDVNGQGILSEYPGTGGHRLQFDRRQPGQTVITDAQGRQTTYTHAIVQGHYRLLESRGAGCTPCSPANQRYRYDSQARLTHQIDLNAQGQAVRGWRFYPDHQGRTLATAMLVFDTQGQAREHIVEQRQYQGDSPWPVVVRTPSVVQGRWREQRWSYNAQGQPTRVVQTGWVPALPQGAAGTGGTVEPQPIQPLKREVSYSYQRINNRSVLVAVDGPLPGTADTRRYVWDKRGDFVST
ncbi:MAG TPA: DUF6531 domain-containing protein, partial [Aquabacterium sp.]|nr:DUF6531 domain-containing protein [Aquabacterium sp.]